jgi:hypothetical protein
MRRSSWVVILGALLGCSPDYSYVPTTGADVVSGHVASRYGVPDDQAPHGDVTLLSYGMARLEGQRALHVRVVISNTSDSSTWVFDTYEQKIELDKGQIVGATFFSAGSGDHASVATIVPASKQTVDLYFVLPADLQRSKELPAFDLVSTLHTERGVTTHRTPFERVEVPAPTPVGPTQSWGAPNWNPFLQSSP